MTAQERLLALCEKRRIANYPDGIHILSLDWDAWTGDTMDYLSHCGYCGYCSADDPKDIRRGALRHAYDHWKHPLSYVQTVGMPLGLFVAECHVDMIYVGRPSDTVTLVDSHEDMGQARNGWDCGSWGGAFAEVRHIFPKHKGIRKIRGQYDLIFICLSSPWTPREADKNFYNFVSRVANRCENTTPVFIGHRKDEMQRMYQEVTR